MAEPTRNRRNERKEETREQILLAATDLLAKHGYAALRVAAVATATGVSLGGLLHHFPAKDTLVLAVLERLSVSALEGARHDAARDRPDSDIFQRIADSAERFYNAPEFLIYLDIFLSVRRHTLIGDTATSLLLAQRISTEALWLPQLVRAGIDEQAALPIFRMLWGLARGLAISSDPNHAQSDRATLALAVNALRRTSTQP